MHCVAGLTIAAFLSLGLGTASPVGAQPMGDESIGRVNDDGWDMGPPASAEIVAGRCAAADMPEVDGPFEPTWESLAANYRTPEWFRDAKFGLYMHWGLYSIPAHHNEWYLKHMYGNRGIQRWHEENFGPVDEFGYKDFIPRFTAEKFDPEAWAELFAASGARYVLPTAEHHDGFSLWDSDVNPYNSAVMGPKRDLMGELAAAVRKHGIKFGMCNHSIEHFNFIEPMAGATDLRDPAWADFYVADRSEAALERHLADWLRKNVELIDKYQPDALWFDNGVNHRIFDPLKLAVAAYYYNRARGWGKEVTIISKKGEFPVADVQDYERQHRAPAELTDFVWQPDDPIGPTFGYTTDMPAGSAESFIRRIVGNASRNGNYGLNLSPTGDGEIPANQRDVLLEIGRWLQTNGEAIYETRPWRRDEERDWRFTTRGDVVYAISLRWPGEAATIGAMRRADGIFGEAASVELLGHEGELEFEQDGESLRVTLPAEPVGEHAWALRVTQK